MTKAKTSMNKQINAVLFDLDGTLLDTAPDLVYALNRVRQAHQLPDMSLATMRQIANLGSKAMIKLAFGVEEDAHHYQELRAQFIAFYEENIATSTQLFPNIERVLHYLERENIPWGIVTNKLTRHTFAVLKKLNLDQRPACVICGDTLPQYKPHPAPILHACHLVKQQPEHCLYVGDAATDVLASKAAGTKSLVALYGYINEIDEDPFSWQADGYIKEPLEIIQWIKDALSA